MAKDEGSSSREKTTRRTRLAPRERKQQLLTVAAKLITDQGIDRLQITDLALAAGVTRPVVYRFFPNRIALVVELMEAFEKDMTYRFLQSGMRKTPRDLEGMVRLFVNAACDTIEDYGAGPWHLLAARAPDPEIAQLGQEITHRLMSPWKDQLSKVTGANTQDIETLSLMTVSAGRAVLNLWLEGTLTREQAVQYTSLGFIGLLDAFTQPNAPGIKALGFANRRRNDQNNSSTNDAP
ncbi:MAG: TetR/AcrR family transcriptional regulator [Myxococcota bacterium]